MAKVYRRRSFWVVLFAVLASATGAGLAPELIPVAADIVCEIAACSPEQGADE